MGSFGRRAVKNEGAGGGGGRARRALWSGSDSETSLGGQASFVGESGGEDTFAGEMATARWGETQEATSGAEEGDVETPRRRALADTESRSVSAVRVEQSDSEGSEDASPFERGRGRHDSCENTLLSERGHEDSDSSDDFPVLTKWLSKFGPHKANESRAVTTPSAMHRRINHMLR